MKELGMRYCSLRFLSELYWIFRHRLRIPLFSETNGNKLQKTVRQKLPDGLHV